jgi:hypothetical protein
MFTLEISFSAVTVCSLLGKYEINLSSGIKVQDTEINVAWVQKFA